MRTLRALRVFLACVALTIAVSGCRQQTKAAAAPTAQQTTWRKLGEWSGRGDVQTESFATDTGALRVRWKAAVTPGAKPGRFVLAIHSSISGRPLQVAVDRDSPGEGIAYVTDDPHTCFAKVESQGFEWAFTVEEGVFGHVVPRAQ